MKPDPVITEGIISGDEVTFSIIIVNEDSPDGCGDFTDLVGSISGNTISGTINGHDCANFCTWEGNFTVTIYR